MKNFYSMLKKLRYKYRWSIEGNQIVGKSSNGQLVNPVTAVAYELSQVRFPANKKSTLKAAKFVGMERDTCAQLYDASKATDNRGNVQVLRGRIRAALGL